MPGIWTDERRARAREIALQIQPWLKSTGPKSTEGKAVAARNAFRGGVRPNRRAVRRECKVALKGIIRTIAWLEMEERIDAWIEAQLAAGAPITSEAMRRAGLRELQTPPGLPAELLVDLLAGLLGPLGCELGDLGPR